MNDAFRRNILELGGRQGAAWLDSIPELVRELENRWCFRSLEPFENLSYGYAAPGVKPNGQQVVLKLAFRPAADGNEPAALRHMAGPGVVRLLESDPGLGAMLLERIRPGTTLASLWSPERDDEATRIAARAMKQLWRPPESAEFEPIERWASAFDRALDTPAHPLPRGLMERARSTMLDLTQSSGPRVLIHGDLQHYNLLLGRAGDWVVIDPKGVLAEPEAEVGPLLRNPLWPPVAAFDFPVMLDRRLDLLAEELGFERGRLRKWAFVSCALSAAWSAQDHGDGWELSLRCAELLDG